MIRLHFHTDASVDVAITAHDQETESRVSEAVPARLRRGCGTTRRAALPAGPRVSFVPYAPLSHRLSP